MNLIKVNKANKANLAFFKTCTGTDGIRPVLNGLYVKEKTENKIVIVTTDSVKMAMLTFDCCSNEDKVEEGKIYSYILTSSWLIITDTISGKYPNFDVIIPSEEKMVSIGTPKDKLEAQYFIAQFELINNDLLAKLGWNNVEIFVGKNPNTPVILKGNDIKALIMPISNRLGKIPTFRDKKIKYLTGDVE